jgi:superoxide dismutase, Fe-Mn family
MAKFEEYVKDVMSWNKQLINFFESEQIGKDEEIWGRLERFAEIVENLSSSPNNEQINNLQSQAEILQGEMERYFSERQKLGSIWMKEPSVQPGGHTLPPLPYAYDALEPVISREIMQLHHDKHHRSYVDGLNKAENMLKKARESNDFSLIKHWSRELSFHGSGHNLHTIFWNNMRPNGGGMPSGKLLSEIEAYFGSFEGFKKQFGEAAKEVEGGGWALLVWAPRSRHLEILQSEKHNNLTQWDTVPLLVLDVWEHAYYLQYKNNRGEYIKNWWSIVNWRDVDKRFEEASRLKWKAY